MADYDIAIIGGGFAGIYASWRLARDGMRVALVEASDHLGGTLWSWSWRGFMVDPGTHNLDLRSPIGAEFYEDILRDNIVVSQAHNWASTMDRAWTYGFEMPDFSADDAAFCATALRELEGLRTSGGAPDGDGYDAWLVAQVGPTLAGRLRTMLAKVVGGSPDGLDVEARGHLGMFARPKLGSDTQMAELKQTDSFWDDRLGVTLDYNDPRFAGRSTTKRFGYPETGGLRAFCTAATERLTQAGVTILTQTCVQALETQGCPITLRTSDGDLRAGRAFWTLPDHSLLDVLGLDLDLKATALPVGCAFYAFEVQARDIVGPDYLHDFSDTRLPYRYNSCGLYSRQVRDNGTTFVMAEIPSHPATLPQLKTPEVEADVWRAMCGVGFVRPDATPSAQSSWSYPVAFTLPRVGWEAPMDTATNAITERAPKVSTVAFGHRGRHAFMTHFENTLQHELKA